MKRKNESWMENRQAKKKGILKDRIKEERERQTETKKTRKWERSIERSGLCRGTVGEAAEMKGCLLICSLTGELKLISETSVCLCLCVCVCVCASGCHVRKFINRHKGAQLCLCELCAVFCVCVCVFMQGCRETGHRVDRLKGAETEQHTLTHTCAHTHTHLDFGQITFYKGHIFSNAYYCWVTYSLIEFHIVKKQGQTF